MKTIYFILPSLDSGGAERIVLSIINNINYECFTPKLILFQKKGDFLPLLDSRVEIIDLNITRIRFSLLPLFRIFFSQKPNIVFAGWGEIGAYLAPFIKLFPKTKFIVRETNVVSQHVKRKDIRFFYKFYNNFETIIAQSNDMKKDLIKHLKIKKSKIKLINNPVDFNFISKQIKKTDEQLFLKNKKTLLAVGNVSYRKGFDLLIKLMPYLDENVHLYIIGEGAQLNEFESLANKLNVEERVHFLGKKTNPYSFMNQADLFILSSRHEGFPNVLLEAGACGTYSIANNCKGGISEIVQSGINGEICEINKPADFAKIIEKNLLISHNKEVIKNSISSRFDKEIILDKFYNLFQTI